MLYGAAKGKKNRKLCQIQINETWLSSSPKKLFQTLKHSPFILDYWARDQ